MDGMNGNPANMQQINNFNNNMSPSLNNNNAELNPNRQAVVDRLKKRMNLYRKRQNESIPRFDQTFSGICEQQSVETNVLQKRFVESKAKRVAKKADKKQTDVTVAQTKTQIKRPADSENDLADAPPVKIPSTGNDNMKFQVEIVQQLEFTTSVANLQPQQISTNVTVKAMTNGSLKYEPQEIKGMKMEPGKIIQNMVPPAPPDILQDFKQEPDNEFADLDFGGLANFMANDENELKKLFSNISEVFDQDLFDQDKIKQEPQNIPQMNHQSLNQMNQLNQQQFNHYVMPECQMQKPMQMHQQQQQRMFQPQNEMSPAAQTLKHMAQQHQVKNSMAMSYMRPSIGPTILQQQSNQQRMPYQPQQQFNDYSSQFHKTQIPFTPDMIKQEIMMPQMANPNPMHQMKPVMHQMVQEDVKNIVPHYQQSYQNNQFNHQNQQRNTFNPNQNPNMINIAMKQTQQMQFNGSTTSGGNIHIQGGQQMTGRMGDFSMQQQQQMYFNQYNNQRPGHHHQGGEGPTSFNMMQNQSMSFTQ